MGRILGASEIRLMAAIAGCREGQVIVVGVALRTGDSDVCAGQRERGGVVIEGSAAPIGC